MKASTLGALLQQLNLHYIHTKDADKLQYVVYDPELESTATLYIGFENNQYFVKKYMRN